MRKDNLAPIFIIGSYRSGTSVTSWCLGQHHNIWVLPETYWLANFAAHTQDLYKMGTAHDAAHFTRCSLTEDDFYLEAAEFIDRVVRRGQERRVRRVLTHLQNGGEEPPALRIQRAPLEPKERWVDATPENAHSVAHILRIFPSARFIHLVRSPHEVVRSLVKFDQAGGEPQEARDAYATWRRLAGASFEAEQEFGSDVVRRFFYEDLISEPEQTLRGMLRFVGEKYRPHCIEPLERRMNSSKVDEDAVFTEDTVPRKLRAEFRSNEDFFQELRNA